MVETVRLGDMPDSVLNYVNDIYNFDEIGFMINMIFTNYIYSSYNMSQNNMSRNNMFQIN
jgi:hypothetical protein